MAEALTSLADFRQNLDNRLAAMITDRYSWWVHWMEVAKYLIPRRYKWLITPNQANRGSPINQAIIDNTGTIALRTLQAGMMSGMTSPGRPWFRLTLDDDDLAEAPAVRIWLDEVESRMRTVFAESNFYTSMATLYGDLGSFGTGVMIIYEDFEDVIRCYNSCAGEYCLANSDRQAIDTMYRQFVMTAPQMGVKFGVENCGIDVQGMIKSRGAGMTQEFVVAHAIEPNNAKIQGAPQLGPEMTYREAYWQWGSTEQRLLSMRGFHECPIIAPRWDIVANDAYGRSPGMDALGDIKQLQVQQKRKAQAIDKMVNPPMVADVTLKNEPATLLPGGVTYVANLGERSGFRPAYEVKPDLQHMVIDMAAVQDRIKDTFFTDLFLMISQLDTVRTATEIDARREEKLIQLGPVLERFENEALDPAINRTFNIMLRAGLLPPIPQELAGKSIKAEYISMLAQAQKAAMTMGIERLSAYVGRVGAAIPPVMDTIDWDEAVKLYGDLLDVPAAIINSSDKVAEIRGARAEQQQEQEAIAQASAGVEAAKVLAGTPMTMGGV